jgi:hypothetical protein
MAAELRRPSLSASLCATEFNGCAVFDQLHQGASAREVLATPFAGLTESEGWTLAMAKQSNTPKPPVGRARRGKATKTAATDHVPATYQDELQAWRLREQRQPIAMGSIFDVRPDDMAVLPEGAQSPLAALAGPPAKHGKGRPRADWRLELEPILADALPQWRLSRAELKRIILGYFKEHREQYPTLDPTTVRDFVSKISRRLQAFATICRNKR